MGNGKTEALETLVHDAQVEVDTWARTDPGRDHEPIIRLQKATSSVSIAALKGIDSVHDRISDLASAIRATAIPTATLDADSAEPGFEISAKRIKASGGLAVVAVLLISLMGLIAFLLIDRSRLASSLNERAEPIHDATERIEP